MSIYFLKCVSLFNGRTFTILFLAQNKSGLMTMLTKALLKKKNPNCFYLFSEGEGRKAFTLNSIVLAIYTGLVVTAD